MSRFSGACDLYDHIMMENLRMGAGQECQVGGDSLEEEIKCFEKFKKNTGGIIYQPFELELNEANIEEELKRANQVILSRDPDGVYHYLNRKFRTLRDLNKEGYHTSREIKFKDILDIIPYYPYVIGVASCSPDKEYIQIAKKSETEKSYLSSRQYGLEFPAMELYRDALKKHYKEVILYLDKNRGDMNERLRKKEEG